MLLSVRDNKPYKSRGSNVEFLRDLCCLYFREDGTWNLVINENGYTGDDIWSLEQLLNEIKLEKQSKHRSQKNLRKLVVWVNNLNLYIMIVSWAVRHKLEIAEKKDFETGKKILMVAHDDDFEFRNFMVMTGQNVERTAKDFKIQEEGVFAMKAFLLMQDTQDWTKFRWTMAYYFEKKFYRRIGKVPEISYEVMRRRQNKRFNEIVDKSNKGGYIWIDPDLRGQMLKSVVSHDLRSAYCGEFVKGDDFPIGSVGKTARPFEKVLEEEKWWAILLEANECPQKRFLNWLKPFEENGKWYFFLEIYDYKCLELFNRLDVLNQFKIKEIYVCNEIGRIHSEVRKALVDIFEERNRMRDDGDAREKFLKFQLEVAYGKGIQKRDYKGEKYFRYFCPQLSYHALTRTHYELCLMISRLEFDITAVDTDSFKTQSPLAENLVFQRNKELKQQLADAGFPNTTIGTWKYEGCYNKFVQFAKKVYAYEKDGKLECKFAGCNGDQLKAYLEATANCDIEWLMQEGKVVGGTVWKTVQFKPDGYFVETKLLDYSLDPEELDAFLRREDIKVR